MSYIRPGQHHYSFGSILRITQEEWEEALGVDFYAGFEKIHAYPAFTMYQNVDFDYLEVIDIYLRHKWCKHEKCHAHMKFGPYKSSDRVRARVNALKFLVDHGYIKIVTEVAN